MTTFLYFIISNTFEKSARTSTKRANRKLSRVISVACATTTSLRLVFVGSFSLLLSFGQAKESKSLNII